MIRPEISSFLAKEGISHRYLVDFMVPLSKMSAIKIGGPADIVVKPRSIEAFTELLQCLDACHEVYKILGRGTNVLPSDEGFRGVIISTSELSHFQFEDQVLSAECGASLSLLAKEAALRSLSGWEGLYGIPGSIGGAVYMNAGAFGTEIAESFLSAQCYDPKSMKVYTMGAEEMQFSYRHSICHERTLYILSAAFRFSSAPQNDIFARMEACMQKRKNTQPWEYPNLGSTFKRPAFGYAGKWIEDAGWKGKRVGGAMVSEKHAGFIVNVGNATAADVRALISQIQESVYQMFQVSLDCEIEFLAL